jgi:hypothetical protein
MWLTWWGRVLAAHAVGKGQEQTPTSTSVASYRSSSSCAQSLQAIVPTARADPAIVSASPSVSPTAVATIHP